MRFEKPFRSASTSAFLPAPAGTEVVRRMTGEQSAVAALVGRIVPMDRLFGGDLQEGLTRLATAAGTG